MTGHDEIRRYLDENGSKYTREALRVALLSAGHAEADVDAALAEWSVAREAAQGSPEDRAQFRRWALWFHLGALLVMIAVVILLKGIGQGGVILLGAAVLVIALLIGWWLSSLIGRALLPRTGVTVALIAPLISALVLGGTCIGLMNAAIPTPPTDGTVTLDITSPAAFSGSGGAACHLHDYGADILSQDLGQIEGMTVTTSIFSVSPTTGGDPVAAGTSLSVTIGSPDDPEAYQYYSSTSETAMEVQVSNDGATGQITFDGLAPDPGSGGSGSTLEPLSGSVSWTCEA